MKNFELPIIEIYEEPDSIVKPISVPDEGSQNAFCFFCGLEPNIICIACGTEHP